MVGFQCVIHSNVGLYISGWLVTGFDVYVDGTTLIIDQEIDLCFSYIFFEGFNDGNIEVLVTVVGDGINDVVSWCVACDLGIFLCRCI